MEYLFYLNGDHPDLARYEITSLLSAYGHDVSLRIIHPQLVLLSSRELPRPALERLSLTHSVGTYMGGMEASTGSLEPSTIEHIMCDDPFSVRIKKLDKGINAMEEERRLARQILSVVSAPVDLGSPAQRIVGFHVAGTIHVANVIASTSAQAFDGRKPQYRPYFHPSSLHPRIARVLVNISQARREVFDPFCGTGGILIEAGLMGLETFGMDIEEKMVIGTRENLAHFGLEGDVRKGDATRIGDTFDEPFECIVSDLPYGKSTVVAGGRERLYARAFEQMYEHSLHRLVTVIPVFFDFASRGYTVESHFTIRVHRSLERHIHVLSH